MSLPDCQLASEAFIGLGANLEDPPGMLRKAVSLLARTPGLTFKTASSIYLTEPQGGPEQNWFHNAVVIFKCELDPLQLLKLLLETEALMGRQRLEYCGPRVIDLDLLACGALVLNQPPELIVPHPRLHQRLFVLAPLEEVAPHWRHPLLDCSVEELYKAVSPEGQGLKKTEGSLTPEPGRPDFYGQQNILNT